MIAVGGEDCVFLAVVLNGDDNAVTQGLTQPRVQVRNATKLVSSDFIDTVEDTNGMLQQIKFLNADNFNFAYDVVDVLGKEKPEKLAMIYLDKDKNERKFTFKEMMKESSRTANYFKSLGIKRGDRVLVLLKRSPSVNLIIHLKVYLKSTGNNLVSIRANGVGEPCKRGSCKHREAHAKHQDTCYQLFLS